MTVSKPDAANEQDLLSYDSFGRSGKSGQQNFLWWCAGAHQELLRKFPSEQTKYAGLGGVLLATFVLATLSSGYAIYSVFGNVIWTIAFSLIWGLIIFNFDRFLVATMRKYGVSKRKQLLMAIPRLALAFLIGLTIARPLELKIFEKEIAVKMTENLHKKIQNNDSLLQIENKALTLNANNTRQEANARKLGLEDTLQRLQSDYLGEADGTGGSRQKGIQGLTRLKMEAYNNALNRFSPEIKYLDSTVKYQDSLLMASRSGQENKRREFEKQAASNQGFLEKNKALTDLAATEDSVWWTSVLLSLLIILIEIGPLLSKFIMPLGPYDIALAREELLQMATDENAIRKGKEVDFEKQKAFYKKQKQMADELVDKLTELQKKHIDEELDKWERGEWDPKDHRASMDEVLRRIKEKYQLEDEDLF